MKKEKHQFELLAPAGSFKTFQAVIHAGADAVYLGGTLFGARAYANNFSNEELLTAIEYAHIHHRKIFLTVNTLLKEEEWRQSLYEYLLPFYRAGLDAVIVQDFGVFSFLAKEFPQMDIHASTQMTVTNWYGAELLQKAGASRIVTARELSFEEIHEIHTHVPTVEIETFVHGALCYCYSGQCLLSSMIGGRSGNRGRCAQPCRLPYQVCDSSGKAIGTAENYILSLKDLCTVEYLPQLADSGVYSLKIEGRMKQAEYAAGVVSIYRECINRYQQEGAEHYKVTSLEMQKLYDFGNRSGFTQDYFLKQNGNDMITFDKPNHAKTNEALQKEIRETYIQNELKEKINGTLRLSKDLPAKLEVSCGTHQVIVTGELVQKAKNQPLSREKVQTSMEKTGSTPFIFDQLDIEMEPDIFLPVQAMNQLRREALEELQTRIAEKAERVVSNKGNPLEAMDEYLLQKQNGKKTSLVSKEKQKNKVPMADDGKFHPCLHVSIQERRMLDTVLDFSFVTSVYLDSACYQKTSFLPDLTEDIERIHQKKMQAFYVMPDVFRKRSSDFFESIETDFFALKLDGIVIKSYDALEFIRKHQSKSFPVVLDANMYAFHTGAQRAFAQYEPLRDTVPLELNRKEILARDNRNSELIIYGILPLMTSAQCVYANTSKCDQVSGVCYLKDRYKKSFPVKNQCMACYNTVYNSLPMVLFEHQHDFFSMGLRNYRISFTLEKPQRIQKVLNLYREIFIEQKSWEKEMFGEEYTNGHYKRGIL